MIGMLIKDLYVLASMAKGYLLMMAVFLALNVTGIYDTNIFGVLFIVLLLVMPTTAFAYDEQAGWDKYAVSTPAGRRGVVRGKYLFVLLLWVLALAVVFGTEAIGALVRGQEMGEAMLSGAVMLSTALIMQDILLPILFKFGSQKSRLAMMVVMGVAAGGGVALTTLLGDRAAQLLPLLMLLLPVIALGGMGISYFTALSIYQKKDL